MRLEQVKSFSELLTPLSTSRNESLLLTTINAIFISIIIFIIILICLDNHLLSRARVLASPIIPHLVQLRVERLHFDAFKHADIVLIYKWDINVVTVRVMNKINYLCMYLPVGPGFIVKCQNYERGH